MRDAAGEGARVRFLRKTPRAAPAPVTAALIAVTGAARQPALYGACGVPDTLDGRFDMVCLHGFLAMRRLKAIGNDESAAFSQALFDALFADMDAALRQIGVSDLRIGKEVKKLAKAFLGRVTAYDAALSRGDDAELREALVRNVCRGGDGGVDVDALARYTKAAAAVLAAQADDRMLAGEFPFPDPACAYDLD
ncbi:MAG: ubiquinol-cytochrome C chaperone family protein [Rhodospirillaceae bacterium]